MKEREIYNLLKEAHHYGVPGVKKTGFDILYLDYQDFTVSGSESYGDCTLNVVFAKNEWGTIRLTDSEKEIFLEKVVPGVKEHTEALKEKARIREAEALKLEKKLREKKEASDRKTISEKLALLENFSIEKLQG